MFAKVSASHFPPTHNHRSIIGLRSISHSSPSYLRPIRRQPRHAHNMPTHLWPYCPSRHGDRHVAALETTAYVTIPSQTSRTCFCSGTSTYPRSSANLHYFDTVYDGGEPRKGCVGTSSPILGIAYLLLTVCELGACQKSRLIIISSHASQLLLSLRVSKRCNIVSSHANASQAHPD